MDEKIQEKKYPCKRRTKADGKRLNMYVVIDFKQYRGMTTRMMTDADFSRQDLLRHGTSNDSSSPMRP